jgi:hypothetical protein
MDLIINFIGIILLYHTVNGSGVTTSITAYVPDGRSDPVACASFIPEHFAFIRVTTPIDESKIDWPYVACDQGADCKLFPLDKDEITIADVVGGADGVDLTVKPTVGLMPKYKDYSSEAITPAEALKKSVASMTFSKGVFTGHAAGNGMLYTRLSIPTTGSVITIKGKGRSFVVSRGTSIDVINLPRELALGVPGSHVGGGDRTHYFLYHLVADKMPASPCVSPADPKKITEMANKGHEPGAAAEVSLSIACSNTNYP